MERSIWSVQNEEETNNTRFARIEKGQNNNNSKNYFKDGPDRFVSVQSRFRRNGYLKYYVVVLLSVLFVIAFVFSFYIYIGRHRNQLCETKHCIRASSNLLQSMDLRINPCDDFYQFTCGNWAEDHPKPDSVSSFDWFSEKQMKVFRYIRKYLTSNGTENEPKIIDETRKMFQACMNTAEMDSIGLRAPLDYLEYFRLPNYPSIIATENDESTNLKEFDWIDTIAQIKKTIGLDIIFGFDIFPDPTNKTRNRIVLGSPELNSVLPFKTDYEKRLKRIMNEHIRNFDKIDIFNGDHFDIGLDSKEKSDTAVMMYTNYMIEIISAFVFYSKPGIQIDSILPVIKDSATKIVKMTKYFIEIAENVTESDSNNVSSDLLNVNISEFQNLSNQLITPKTLNIWQKYVETIFQHIDPMFDVTEHLILTSWSDIYYIQQAVQYIQDVPTVELELFIWWSIVEEFILHTTTDFRQIHNEYARSITNLEGSTPRSIYCTSVVNQLMGMAVSYAIVQPDFLQITKPKVLNMIENIRLAFGKLVGDASWMDDKTKCSTLEKSQAMKNFVGFPEWILKTGELDKYYHNLSFNQTTHLKNLIDVLQWQMISKIKTLNYTENLEWATTPTNVNAFHSFQSNAITVPLAILQYPFYNLGLESLNYGALGTILGHEVTHGFDNSGRQFDKDGNMRQWWTNNTISEYINRTECFIKQYNNYYIPEIDGHIDGKTTLSENIADNGGLREAFYAYKLYVERNGKEQLLPGFEQYSHEQLLFISFGNLWCETQTPTAMKMALEDTHCPGRIRLKGVLANSHEFQNAFNCQSYPQTNQCRIW